MDVDEADNTVLASVGLNSPVFRQNGVFSPEDLAWVDSCLNNDFDISESDWIPLRDALLEIISSQSQSFGVDGGEDNESHPYREENNMTLELNQQPSTSDAERLPNPSSTYDVSLISMATETTSDEIPDNELNGTLPSSTFSGNPFLPTYNEDLKYNETFDYGLNLDSANYEMEQTSENIFKVWDLDSVTDELEQASENIFKVWDLDIPSEEGELVKQLKKALSENSLRTEPSAFDVSGKDLKEVSLDDLIAGIADLSLNKKV
ncbi:hypothetical protein L195_g009452 [Trifolium pratense]|uniref:Uncharacterized protein n=2 Tax=Trifolium pratense TaxID=57577 RepID=A0A2K3PBZ4_TRIPR|nr:uncharacterized protein LOC123895356 [Trifolium pratense]PNY12813.1 hypothetical protein L195_g009452 [Trifolium pratense]CAJ2651297.1 unnamed protein product [Trifolium pratense]